ncbi:MAG TPA: hypothetical protein VLH75_12065 [Longimicrobiales bacterium]|nr:hypothetical protein [Longimicrobiales bacterium]
MTTTIRYRSVTPHWPAGLVRPLRERDVGALRAWCRAASGPEVRAACGTLFDAPWMAEGQARLLAAGLLRHAGTVPWELLRLAERDALFMASAAWNSNLAEDQLVFVGRHLEGYLLDPAVTPATLASIVGGLLAQPRALPEEVAWSVVCADRILSRDGSSELHLARFSQHACRILHQYDAFSARLLGALIECAQLPAEFIVDLLIRHAGERRYPWLDAVASPRKEVRARAARTIARDPELWGRPGLRRAALAATDDIEVCFLLASTSPVEEARGLVRGAILSQPKMAVECLATDDHGLLSVLEPLDVAPLLESREESVRDRAFRLLGRVGGGTG